ncbi:hypothetical protein LA02_999 [Francisella philomiragia]|nr:hypothetical protein LA02_999 [Francisella philomiragia]
MENCISSRKPFGLEGGVINKKDLFRDDKNKLKKPILCYGRARKVGYFEEEDINKNDEWISKFKVFVPYANNIGTELNDDNLNAFIGIPNTICTESYIVVGADLGLDAESAKNLCRYFMTQFVRFMHSILKVSQHGTSKTYKFVPLQDFTQNSDIDWSKSIEEIDKQLYKKYNLNKKEIEFIESMIKPME